MHSIAEGLFCKICKKLLLALFLGLASVQSEALLARSAYFALLSRLSALLVHSITEKALNLLTNLLTSTNLRFVRRFVLVLVVASTNLLTNRRFVLVRSCKAKFTCPVLAKY